MNFWSKKVGQSDLQFIPFLPDVNELEVCRLGYGLIDALVHGVHHQHHRQRQSNCHVQVLKMVKQK